MNKAIHIGTSGWHYKHWIGTYYPEKTRPEQQLPTYLKDFSTVEINNSFYRLPGKETFENWYRSVPPGFIFSVKASRYITHMKKLHDADHSVRLFLDHASALREKLGPVLFQLPPAWKPNLKRLDDFLRILPKKHLFTIEFRNREWYSQETYDLLRQHRVAFCIYELDRHKSPAEVTANFVYVRLHGPGGKYQGNYDEATLRDWAAQCRDWARDKQVYVYFDNDQAGYAAFNARRLQQLTSR